MRVLHLGKYYPPVPGGIETHLRELCAGLAARGIDTTCAVSAASHSGSRLQDGRVRVLQFGKLFPSLPPLNPALFGWFARNRRRFDIVHLHLPNPWAALCCLLFPPRRLVVSYHSDVVDKFGFACYRPFQQMLLRRADAVIAASRTYAATSPPLRQARRSCAIIPYGIDTARFNRSDTGHTAALRRLGKPPFFLFVGRLVPYKGLDVLLRAMRDVPGTLFVVGIGLMLKALRQQAESLGIAGRVRFFPRVRDESLGDFYRAADALVLPSVTRAEAFGIVQLEAMACGKPVISTRLGTGVEDVNLHSQTGLTVPPGDSAALAYAMKRLLSSPRAAETLGRNGLHRVKAEFTASRMVAETLRLYEAVLAAR